MVKIELPDIEKMFESIELIRGLTLQKSVLELKISDGESKVTREAYANPKYEVKGRPPSMEFLKKTYLFAGFDGELIPLRSELAEIEANLDREKLKLDLNKKLFDVWRTQSANERDTSFV